MNSETLKKQIDEIDSLLAAGETVDVMLTRNNERAHLKIDRRRASLVSPRTFPAGTAKETDARRFDLDIGAAELTNAEIIKKIEQASGFAPAAASLGLLPIVTLTRDDVRGVWILAAACSYVPDNMDPEHTITALKGFEFDLASIPRIFWSILAPEELSLAAPLFHDLLYRRGGTLVDGELAPPGRIFTRAEVDTLFLELMTKAGIPSWKRRAAYLAVRGFSRFAWKD